MTFRLNLYSTKLELKAIILYLFSIDTFNHIMRICYKKIGVFAGLSFCAGLPGLQETAKSNYDVIVTSD